MFIGGQALRIPHQRELGIARLNVSRERAILTTRRTTARLRGINAVLRRYETQQLKTSDGHNVS
jgi:hypothetical protein